jgi:hypothetical protein
VSSNAIRTFSSLGLLSFVSCNSEAAIRPSTTTSYVLRVQANGAGSGTVTTPDAAPSLSCTITRGALSGVCAAAYPSASTVSLVAAPNASSTFAGWSGACTGADQCVVDMSHEQAVTAAFNAK